MNGSTVLLRFTQVTFWVALMFTFTNAVMPSEHAVTIFSWDKAEHFAAFYILTVLAAAAYPLVNVIWVAIALSAFGAAIEVVQGLQIVGRDCDAWDWAVDSIGIASALAPMTLIAWRRYFATPS